MRSAARFCGHGTRTLTRTQGIQGPALAGEREPEAGLRGHSVRIFSRKERKPPTLRGDDLGHDLMATTATRGSTAMLQDLFVAARPGRASGAAEIAIGESVTMTHEHDEASA